MAGTKFLPDFSTLNAAEREVLALLAQGHTAKSIATLTGRTEGAVNERLREARRKTGIASSRELARLVVRAEPPKNRDEQIGVGGMPSGDAPGSRWSAWRAPRSMGVIAMAIIIGAAALGAALLAFQDTPTAGGSVAADPLLAGSWSAQTPRPASLAELHARLRAETRDAVWAGHAEPAVKARYARAVGPNEALRVTCGATLCEVAGVLSQGERGSAALEAVQNHALYADIAKLGFASDLFTVTSAEKKKLVFVSYWRRR